MIHRVGGYQDVRFMGCLVKPKSLRVALMNVSNLSLCGIPFLSGFYSKDLILETIIMGPVNELNIYLIIVSTGLTVCYTFRLVYFRITGDYNLRALRSVEDEDYIITRPMIFLILGGVCGGSVLC